MYIASARDPKINIQRREYAWYGLWNFVLNHYFLHSIELYIYPQWPVWKLKGQSTISDVSPFTKMTAPKVQRPLQASTTKEDSTSSDLNQDESSHDELDLLPPYVC